MRLSGPDGSRSVPGVWVQNSSDLTLSDQALALVNGDRQNSYGPPVESLTNIGSAWAGVLNLPEPIPAWKVALCLCAMKLVRAGQRADTDSVRDAFGYLHLTERLRPDAE